MRRVLSLLIIIMLLSASESYAESKYDKILDEAYESLMRGEIEKAKENYELFTLYTGKRDLDLETYLEVKSLKGTKLLNLINEAESGNAVAMYKLGNYYSECNLDDKAFLWYKKAALKGEPNAMRELASYYLFGIAVDKNEFEAFRLVKKSAELGNAKSIRVLSVYYRNGIGVSKDSAESIRLCRIAAEKGDVMAMIYMGNFYFDGIELKKDINKAKEWYRKASNLAVGTEKDLLNNIISLNGINLD